MSKTKRRMKNLTSWRRSRGEKPYRSTEFPRRGKRILQCSLSTFPVILNERVSTDGTKGLYVLRRGSVSTLPRVGTDNAKGTDAQRNGAQFTPILIRRRRCVSMRTRKSAKSFFSEPVQSTSDIAHARGHIFHARSYSFQMYSLHIWA